MNRLRLALGVSAMLSVLLLAPLDATSGKATVRIGEGTGEGLNAFTCYIDCGNGDIARKTTEDGDACLRECEEFCDVDECEFAT